MDQLDAIRTFLAVAEHGSLSRAARSLDAPVASVSRKLAALEEHLRSRLVARSTRRLALTRAGHIYAARWREILDSVAAADEEARGGTREPAGTLTVAAPLAFGRIHVLPVVAEVLRDWPALDVRLALSDRNVDLIEERVDAAVRIGSLGDSNLSAIRVGTVRRIVCASPAYLAARGTPATPEDLAAHDCISVTTLGPGVRWSFAGGKTIAVRARLGVSSNEAAISAAVAGVGITRVLSYQAKASLRQGELIPLLELFEPASLPVHLLHGEGRKASASLRAFLDLAGKRLRRDLAR